MLAGRTLLNSSTVIADSSSNGLGFPQGILANSPLNGSLLVVDGAKNQVVQFSDRDPAAVNVSVLIRYWSGTNQLTTPYNIFLDKTRSPADLYVSDSGSHRVLLFSAMQVLSPTPRIVAGTGTAGSGLNELNTPCGIVLDQQRNLIIADYLNHRVVRYSSNATSGTVIIGTGSQGSDSVSLRNPAGLFFDEINALLYVADVFNHRIQRYSLNDTSFPLNGTTVAGGHGQGSGMDQFNQPYDLWISNKTGAIYIADSNNHRIQRWQRGASAGVTVAGDPLGLSGSNETLLRNPYRLAINADETFLYVSDGLNSRIQRFQLI